MLWLLSIAAAHAGLRDAGAQLDGPPVLIPVTPGVSAEAFAPWVEALEDEGLDAWLFEAEAGQGPDAITAALGAAAETLGAGGPLRVAAHGWGGVFALAAGIDAERWALVGVPLASQPLFGPLAGERWPWPEALVGALPAAPVAPEVLATYRAWVSDLPTLTAPSSPALLIASNLDAVAPPEVVRLPSQSWPDRTWARVGHLSLDGHDPLHAELLADPGLARRVADFLEQE